MPGRHFYIQFPGGDGLLFMSSLSPSSSSFPSPVITTRKPQKSTMLHAFPIQVVNHFLLIKVTCRNQQDVWSLESSTAFFFLFHIWRQYTKPVFASSRVDWQTGDGVNLFRPSVLNIFCHPAFFSPAAFWATRAIFIKVLQWRGQFNILELLFLLFFFSFFAFWDKAPCINDNLCFINLWLFLACNKISSVFITTSNKVFQWLCSFELQSQSLKPAAGDVTLI